VANKIVAEIEKGINEKDLVDLALRLVRKPSPQTDKLEYDPQIKAFISKIVVDELKARNIENIDLDAMGNLVCRVGNPNGGKKVFFLAYAMTHPASSMVDPFKGEIIEVNGKKAIRGRGISEQKGSLTAMIAALDFVNHHREQLDGELVFAVSLAGETGRHDAIDSIRKFTGLKADFGVVGIGTDNGICQGNKGRVDVEIIVYGKSCHSSTPEKGINAIEGACEIIKKLKEIELEGNHPKLGKPTLVSTSIKSFPDATHTIQNECHIIYDRRLLPGDDPEAAVEQIRQAIGDISPYKVEVHRGSVTLPSEVPGDSVVVVGLKEAIREVYGKSAKIFYSNSAIDAGYLNKHNIPAVMFGPGNMEFWHTDNEILLIEDLLKGAYIYTYLSIKYLKK